MNTEQQIKLIVALQALFAEFYKAEMSARIKEGKSKKKALTVKNSKV